MTTQIYIVTEILEGKTQIGGIYQNLADAHDHAKDIAEYAGFKPAGKNVWGDDHFGMRVDIHQVN